MIEPFVDAAWLSAHRDQVVLADVRWYLDGRSAQAAFVTGHLPGAVFVELGKVLAAAPSDAAGRHPLPEPGAFAAALSDLGIGDGDTVVAYDDAGGAIAARLVWMLRALERPAAVLDGGIRAWDGPLEIGESLGGRATPHAARSFSARPWPAERLVSIDDVAGASEVAAGTRERGAAASERVAGASEHVAGVSEHVGGASEHVAGASEGAAGDRAVLIDARDRARFRGGPDPVDPRSGHIPGAVNLPAAGNIGADGRLLGVPELRRRFAEVGIEPGTPVISYCGSGVTACLNLLALERAGLGPGRLYPGSWSQWSRDRARPLATGDGSEDGSHTG